MGGQTNPGEARDAGGLGALAARFQALIDFLRGCSPVAITSQTYG